VTAPGQAVGVDENRPYAARDPKMRTEERDLHVEPTLTLHTLTLHSPSWEGEE